MVLFRQLPKNDGHLANWDTCDISKQIQENCKTFNVMKIQCIVPVKLISEYKSCRFIPIRARGSTRTLNVNNVFNIEANATRLRDFFR